MELLLLVSLLLGLLLLLALVAVTELLLLVSLLLGLLLLLLGGLLSLSTGLAIKDGNVDDLSAALLVDNPGETLGAIVGDHEVGDNANLGGEAVLGEGLQDLRIVEIRDGYFFDSLFGSCLFLASEKDHVEDDTDDEHADADDHPPVPLK